MAVWHELALTTPLEVGKYYRMEISLPFNIAESLQSTVTNGIKSVAVTQNAIRFTGIEYVPQFMGGKRAGTLLRLRFQAIPNDAVYEAGFSPKIIFAAVGGLLLIWLTVSGTLKSFAVLADDTIGTVRQALDPATLVGIVIVLLIVLPIFRKGR